MPIKKDLQKNRLPSILKPWGKSTAYWIFIGWWLEAYKWIFTGIYYGAKFLLYKLPKYIIDKNSQSNSISKSQKNPKEQLKALQKIVMPSTKVSYNATFTQLEQATEMYIENNYRIFKDSANIITSTIKSKVFFDRYRLVLDTIYNLMIITEYYDYTNINPVSLADTYNKPYFVNEFLDRFWNDTVEKAMKLQTVNGKSKRYESYFRDIVIYQDQIPTESWAHFQNIKKAYLSSKEAMTKVIALEDI